jgi:division/cell wall cluster transcriptional repressor MraZ
VFVGTSKRKLDDKGRIVLSAALRDELHGPGYIALADGCLAIWTDDGYRQFTDELRRRVREAGDVESVVLRKLAAATSPIRADSQGRVTLPSDLLDQAGITAAPGTELVVNGAFDRIEIWAPEAWEELSEGGNDAVQDAIRKGGL